MNVQEVVEKFLEKPSRMITGKSKLTKQFNCADQVITDARRIARAAIRGKERLKLPKILILDIETAPVAAYVWRLWKQNVGLNQIISDWFMLTWSAKWLFASDIMSNRLTSKEAIKQDDSRIVKNLWKLLEEADMVVAHNGDKFDIPKINARFIVNGLGPTIPYQQIDTKKVASKQFGFSSNKLDALAMQFGFETKMDTDMSLWTGCMKGNDESLKYMEEYNRYDVELLEEIYLKLRPWIKSHPNVGLYVESDNPVCANCGNDSLIEAGHYCTNTAKYETFRCRCGAINRVRVNSYDKDKRQSLIVSVAR